jgi:hypothetical protein
MFQPMRGRVNHQDIARLSQKGLSTRAIGAQLGCSHTTVLRARGAAKEKRRKAPDAPKGVSTTVHAPPARAVSYMWELESIRRARSCQERGQFALPVELAAAIRTDDILFTAYQNRIGPQSVIATRLRPAPSPEGPRLAALAREDVTIPRSTLGGIVGTLANHGIAIGYVTYRANHAGTRIKARLTEWPLGFVWWNPSEACLQTQTREGRTESITHGDGRWVIFRHLREEPWRQDACILPAAFVWAAHAGGISDWAASGRAHGLAQIIGGLNAGTPTYSADGILSPQAKALLSLVQAFASGETNAGLKPEGTTVEFLSNKSTAWQVFEKQILSREKAGARIYLGSDAMLGAGSGAPGVDISALFGISTTRLQADLGTVELALNSGLYRPWTALHTLDPNAAPTFEYLLPDPDAAAKQEQAGEAHKRLYDTLDRMRANQVNIDQDVINGLSDSFGVSPPPKLAAKADASVPLALAPTDVAKVVLVKEARNSQGLPALGDERDALFVSELEAYAEKQNPPPAKPV